MLINYKNFIAKINYISRTGCFYGEVIDCNDLIIFQTENKKDLESAFIIAVEQYLVYLNLLNINQDQLVSIISEEYIL